MNKYLLILFLLLSLLLSARIYAGEIPDHVAMKIIVSEGANQGLKGMICIGEVLRHRGSIKGFSGYKRYGWAHESKLIWGIAKKAWEQSKYTDYTKGADHFMSVHTSSIPSWLRYCVKTYEYKDHVFFKEIYHRI